MRRQDGVRHKLIIFTEHRDTLTYLVDRLRNLLGRPEWVLTIHGGVNRAERRRRQEEFLNNPEVLVLVATDAAGEGVNLQRAHLMVNYDLPWNPNRLEQRFGRIHRIGQTDVCHMWNLVAGETREGAVYQRLLVKLEAESQATGGKVFDVLGAMYTQRPLRELLLDAIRYGEDPEVQRHLELEVENPFDQDELKRIYAERSLTGEHLTDEQVQSIRDDMQRAAAERLQPHHIRSFFLDALQRLGGRAVRREQQRWEITRLPHAVREWKGPSALAQGLAERYERVCFEREHITVLGKPSAALLCPGHPLLDAVVDLTLRQHMEALQHGAVLVDTSGCRDDVRALVYLEHEISDGRRDALGRPIVVSRRLQFVELSPDGQIADAGASPYLNYDPLPPEHSAAVAPLLQEAWLQEDLEQRARAYASEDLARRHFEELQAHTIAHVDKVRAAVRSRLGLEINHWYGRAEALRKQEEAGRHGAYMNSARARQHADELSHRLQHRMSELNRELALVNASPVVVGMALIVPAALLTAEVPSDQFCADAEARRRIERLAVARVMETERGLGREPVDVGVPGHPWDVESRDPATGDLYFIEVKGRAAGAGTVTVTRNEIITAVNQPDRFLLALVEVENDQAREPRYVREPFSIEPEFSVTSINYNLHELLARAEEPT